MLRRQLPSTELLKSSFLSNNAPGVTQITTEGVMSTHSTQNSLSSSAQLRGYHPFITDSQETRWSYTKASKVGSTSPAWDCVHGLTASRQRNLSWILKQKKRPQDNSSALSLVAFTVTTLFQLQLWAFPTKIWEHRGKHSVWVCNCSWVTIPS